MDRRGLVTHGVQLHGVVALTGGLSAVVWVSVGGIDLGVGPNEVFSVTAMRLLSALAAAFAVVTGVLAIARWRLTGDSLAMAAGLGLVVVGATVIGIGGVFSAAPTVAETLPAWLLALTPAGTVTATGCLLGALRLPHVDTSLRLGPSALALTAMLVASTGLVVSSPALLATFGPGTTSAVGRSVLALVWASLALAFARDARVNDRAVSVWIAAFLLCLGQAQLARLLAVPFGTTWCLAARIFTLLGGLVAYAGAVRVSQDSSRVLAARLLDTLVAERTARADRSADREARDELDHDLRSAVMAIGGAATLLEEYGDDLEPAARGSLMESLTSEIARVQRLISRSHEHSRVFTPGAVARRIARCDEARGATVIVDVPDDLAAVGSPTRTAEILRTLLDNAMLHGGGGGVVIRGERADGEVLVFVEDTGRGLPADAVDRMFERGWSRASHPSSGSGLGLFVARRLAEEQNGRLTAHNRPTGGAAFVLTLPAYLGDEA